MTRRVPVIPTVIVVIAVAILIRLGFWQLHRAHENEQLLAQYAAASKQPPIAFPTTPIRGPLPLFRWATGFCQRVVGRRSIAGESRSGETGYAQIVDCATGAEGPGMSVDVGWSQDPNAKVNWTGGLVTGVIVPDRLHGIRLVAAGAPPGLQPSALPSVETAVPTTPTGNRFYALQWFVFAALAALIYVLALRKKWRSVPAPARDATSDSHR
jgi:cytochrome oxidase assembly protein ShyY1